MPDARGQGGAKRSDMAAGIRAGACGKNAACGMGRDTTRGESAPARTASGRVRADRAAQFMPFAALRGYYELVHAQERVVEPRHELTEEEARELSETIYRVRRGQIVRAVHYDRDAYVTTTGCVARIDLIYRTISIVKTTIKLDDLRSLTILEDPEASAGYTQGTPS